MKILGILLLCYGAIALTINNNEDKANSLTHTPMEEELTPSQFSDFWDKGQAEITTYELHQERYGEIHQGTANTIFVTEPFSKSKQVKLDNAGEHPKDNLPAMKLNFTRKFYTGVYPYSTMLSIFTAQDLKSNPYSPKAVFSAQEWCGQSFSQVNLAENGYMLSQFSYFESHGDANSQLGKNLMEDQIWSTIRINPELLPIGDHKVIPSLSYTQLCHEAPGAIKATGQLKTNGKMSTYSLHYPSFERTLTIHFETEFPHRIEKWEEEAYSIGGVRKKMKTTATVKARKMLDYWNKHGLKDAPLRAELGL